MSYPSGKDVTKKITAEAGNIPSQVSAAHMEDMRNKILEKDEKNDKQNPEN